MTSSGGYSGAAQTLAMLGGNGSGAPQEIRYQVELVFRVAGEDLARRPSQPGKDRVHLCLLLLAALDHDPATVDRVVRAADPMAALEPIEHSRDRPGGQTHTLRKVPCGHRPQPADQIHTLSIRTIHSQAVGNCLVHKVELAIQGSDFLEGLLDQ